MTDNERDHLQWVQDCGGSMKAINNPLSVWLTSEGYVERKGELICITEKGKVLLSPPSPFTEFVWKWDTAGGGSTWVNPPGNFLVWVSDHAIRANKHPLIQLARERVSFSLTNIIDLRRTLSQRSRASTLPPVHMYWKLDFPQWDLSTGLVPWEVRQQMQANALPLIFFASAALPPVINKVTGDIDITMSEEGGICTLTVHLWN